MPFFEIPPRSNRTIEAPKVGPWMGPPSNTIGTVVPTRLILCRSEIVVVAANGIVAYPTGCEITVEVRSRGSGLNVPPDHPLMVGATSRASSGMPSIPDGLLRVGVEYKDGSNATNLADPRMELSGYEPEGPVFFVRTGGGHPGHWKWNLWLWPLPPREHFSVVTEWPIHNIELTKSQMDGSAIVEGAEHAVALWADDEPPVGVKVIGLGS